MPPDHDAVDRITEQWRQLRPDLDTSAIEIIGRLSRLSRLIDRELDVNFAAHGIESWMYDVLATLYRTGPPHELTPGDLVRQSMVTTGAITNRIDRLVDRGLVRRERSERDRRSVVVGLTEAGRTLVEQVAPDHLATEERILGALTEAQRPQLVRLLRSLTLELGDVDNEGRSG